MQIGLTWQLSAAEFQARYFHGHVDEIAAMTNDEIVSRWEVLPPQKMSQLCGVALLHISSGQTFLDFVAQAAEGRVAPRTSHSTIETLFTFTEHLMSSDLLSMSNDDFDNWLRDISDHSTEGDLSEDRLVELVSATLREVEPATRARGFVDLANMY